MAHADPAQGPAKARLEQAAARLKAQREAESPERDAPASPQAPPDLSEALLGLEQAGAAVRRARSRLDDVEAAIQRRS